MIFETSATRLYWHDEEQTVLINEVFEAWTYEIAKEAVVAVNDTIRAHDKQISTLHLFNSSAMAVPKGMTVSNIRNLMLEDPPNEELVIFVNAPLFLQVLIGTVSSVYRLRSLFPKYQYCKTIDEALDIIARHKDKQVK